MPASEIKYPPFIHTCTSSAARAPRQWAEVAHCSKQQWWSAGMQVHSRADCSGPVRNCSCTKINCVVRFYLFPNLLFSCLLWKDETYVELLITLWDPQGTARHCRPRRHFRYHRDRVSKLARCRSISSLLYV